MTNAATPAKMVENTAIFVVLHASILWTNSYMTEICRSLLDILILKSICKQFGTQRSKGVDFDRELY